MRPFESRASSIARSTAQSECCELSTGTKTSVYMEPQRKVNVAGARSGPSMLSGPGQVNRSGCCRRRARYSLVPDSLSSHRRTRRRRRPASLEVGDLRADLLEVLEGALHLDARVT